MPEPKINEQLIKDTHDRQWVLKPLVNGNVRVGSALQVPTHNMSLEHIHGLIDTINAEFPTVLAEYKESRSDKRWVVQVAPKEPGKMSGIYAFAQKYGDVLGDEILQGLGLSIQPAQTLSPLEEFKKETREIGPQLQKLEQLALDPQSKLVYPNLSVLIRMASAAGESPYKSSEIAPDKVHEELSALHASNQRSLQIINSSRFADKAQDLKDKATEMCNMTAALLVNPHLTKASTLANAAVSQHNQWVDDVNSARVIQDMITKLEQLSPGPQGKEALLRLSVRAYELAGVAQQHNQGKAKPSQGFSK